MSKEQEREALKAQEEFIRAYMMSGPYSEYVNMVSLSHRFIVEWIKKGQVGSPEDVIEELRKAGEDPDERYIFVGLEKPLPDYLKLPEVYKGFKVFVQVIGKIDLL